jgi:hypothetical protein
MTYLFCVFSVLLFGREAPTYCYIANSYTLARLETERFWIAVFRWQVKRIVVLLVSGVSFSQEPACNILVMAPQG